MWPPHGSAPTAGVDVRVTQTAVVALQMQEVKLVDCLFVSGTPLLKHLKRRPHTPTSCPLFHLSHKTQSQHAHLHHGQLSVTGTRQTPSYTWPASPQHTHTALYPTINPLLRNKPYLHHRQLNISDARQRSPRVPVHPLNISQSSKVVPCLTQHNVALLIVLDLLNNIYGALVVCCHSVIVRVVGRDNSPENE